MRATRFALVRTDVCSIRITLGGRGREESPAGVSPPGPGTPLSRHDEFVLLLATLYRGKGGHHRSRASTPPTAIHQRRTSYSSSRIVRERRRRVPGSVRGSWSRSGPGPQHPCERAGALFACLEDSDAVLTIYESPSQAPTISPSTPKPPVPPPCPGSVRSVRDRRTQTRPPWVTPVAANLVRRECGRDACARAQGKRGLVMGARTAAAAARGRRDGGRYFPSDKPLSVHGRPRWVSGDRVARASSDCHPWPAPGPVPRSPSNAPRNGLPRRNSGTRRRSDSLPRSGRTPSST